MMRPLAIKETELPHDNTSNDRKKLLHASLSEVRHM
jgi:hypothetical protein